MEMIKGGTLFKFIQEREILDEKEASLLIKSVLLAVEHVHSKNIVHRDLKPDNILIDDPLDLTSIKLVDFGLSGSIRINTSYSLNERMGTLLYMAPE